MEEKNKLQKEIEKDKDILDYYFIIKKKLFLIIFFTILFPSIVLVKELLSPKFYKAEALLMIPKEQIGSNVSMLSQLNLPISLPGLGSIADIYPAILRSSALTKKVINDLNLIKIFSKRDSKLKGKLIPLWQVALQMKSNLSVEKDKIGTINLTYIDTDPDLCAKILNKYIIELKNFNEQKSFTVAKKQKIFIESKLKITENKLRTAEEKLKNFQTNNKVIAPDKETEEKIKAIAQLEAQRESAKISLNEDLQRRDIALQKLSQQTKTKISLKTIGSNPVVQNLKDALTQLQIKKANLSLTQKEDHPDVILLQNELNNTREQIKKEMETILQSQQIAVNPIYEGLKESIIETEVDIAGLKAREFSLNKIINNLKPPISKDVPNGLQYARLLREFKIQEIIYTTLRQQFENAKIEEARESAIFEVVDWAEVPHKKFKPKVGQSVIVAGVISIFLTIFFILALDYLEDLKKQRIKSSA